MRTFELDYLCLFQYPQPVWDSHNVLRAVPTSDSRQTVISSGVQTRPATRVCSYSDYFGTQVNAIGIRRPHRKLEIRVQARVLSRQTDLPGEPTRRASLHAPRFMDEHFEYLQPSPHTRWNETLTEAADEISARTEDDVLGIVAALANDVRQTLAYRPGSTYVGIELAEILRRRHGVCQDFSHLLVAMCRSVGIPARYVSGFFFAREGHDGGEPEDSESAARSWAWVEVAIPGHGWLGFDATHGAPVGERHVKVGHGRDYDDVAPLRGVYQGPFHHGLDVSIRMREIPDV